MHEDHGRLRPLLCRAFLGALSRRSGATVRKRLRPDATSRQDSSAARLETPPHDLRELDERPVPQGGSEILRRSGVRYDGGSTLARVPGAHEAQFAYARLSADP